MYAVGAPETRSFKKQRPCPHSVSVDGMKTSSVVKRLLGIALIAGAIYIEFQALNLFSPTICISFDPDR